MTPQATNWETQNRHAIAFFQKFGHRKGRLYREGIRLAVLLDGYVEAAKVAVSSMKEAEETILRQREEIDALREEVSILKEEIRETEARERRLCDRMDEVGDLLDECSIMLCRQD